VKLSQMLFTQGFGTRRECAALAGAGAVRIGCAVVDDPDKEVFPAGLVFEVGGQTWPYRERALVMLHKPAGYECSREPRHHPSVLALLPAPLCRRGVQPVGRLDEDTTGLLLLTDDGALIHRLTSPKKRVPKIYDVKTRHPVTAELVHRLRAGVVLADAPAPVRAAACEAIDEHRLRVTITEGKYHQVKRMVAAAGNRVDALHRRTFGTLELPADLAPGQWRWLDDEQGVL
jgi:16S rRNA pseudouridine516 synthase